MQDSSDEMTQAASGPVGGEEAQAEQTRALADAEPAEATVVQGEEGEIILLDTEVTYPATMPDPTQATRSLPEPPASDVNLNIPFVHQLWDTSDWFNGHWACGPTSCSMVLAYYGLLDPKPMSVSTPFSHTNDYGWYLANPFSAHGRTFDSSANTSDGRGQGLYGSVVDNVAGIGWCAVASSRGGQRGVLPTMTAFLKTRGNSITSVGPSEAVAKASLDAGHPVIVSGRPFGLNGHLMVIRGYYYDARSQLYGWIMNDPYGYRSDGTRDYDGTNVVYLWSEIKPKYMYVISGPYVP